MFARRWGFSFLFEDEKAVDGLDDDGGGSDTMRCIFIRSKVYSSV